MENNVYLYPYSWADAHRQGESALWEASFRANVSCARDIEAVIRVFGDGGAIEAGSLPKRCWSGGASSEQILFWPTP